jgi:hypothetical protein
LNPDRAAISSTDNRSFRAAAGPGAPKPWQPSKEALGTALLSAGKYDEAAVHCQKAGNAQCLGRARLGQGRMKEAIEILGEEVNRGIPVGHPTRGYLGYAYARIGAERVPSALTWFYVFAGIGAGCAVLAPIALVAAFPTAFRFTGVSVSYNVAYAIFGGLTL